MVERPLLSEKLIGVDINVVSIKQNKIGQRFVWQGRLKKAISKAENERHFSPEHQHCT
jgi:hypothetical protein